MPINAAIEMLVNFCKRNLTTLLHKIKRETEENLIISKSTEELMLLNCGGGEDS